MMYIHPLTPKSDQYMISCYNLITLSRRKLMRIKKILHFWILSDVTPNSQN